MKIGCLASLSLLVGAVALFYHIGQIQLAAPGLYVFTGVGGVVLWLGISMLQAPFYSQNEAKLIARCRDGQRPEDGKAFAALGEIVAVGEPLLAPASQTACAAYSYQVVLRPGDSEDRGIAYSGICLTPSSIRTSFGELRLLGCPMLDNFGDRVYSDAESLERMSKYIANTKFVSLEGFGVVSAFSEIKALLNDSDGEVRKDLLIRKLDSLAGYSVVEEVIPVRSQVCVIGKYSAQGHGLVSDFQQGMVIRAWPGDSRQVEEQLKGSTWIQVAVGIVFSAVSLGALYAVHTGMFP